jgi:hypothetical protein
MGVVVLRLVVSPDRANPGLWRWALHLGDRFDDPSSCLGALPADDKYSAAIVGQQCGLAVHRALQAQGHTVDAATVYLDADPTTYDWPMEVL